MPEDCILEAFGTGVPNGNVTVEGLLWRRNILITKGFRYW